jgi:hypothetical protein
MDAVVSPKVARAVAAGGTGVVVIDRSHDQHFYVAGSINGHPVTFMVDTGASVVSQVRIRRRRSDRRFDVVGAAGLEQHGQKKAASDDCADQESDFDRH